MPRLVRSGIWLIATGLICDIVRTFWLYPFPSAIGQVTAIVVLYGGLLVGIAYHRNWARLTFAFLFAFALLFSAIFLSQAARFAPLRLATAICLLLLEGIGLTCLFMPTAAAWYHNRAGAA